MQGSVLGGCGCRGGNIMHMLAGAMAFGGGEVLRIYAHDVCPEELGCG